MSNNKTAIGLALLAGVAIGAGIGILVAPDKGSKTRGKIKGGYDDAKSGLKNRYDAVKDKATHLDVDGTYKDLVSTLSAKSEDVVSFLESKLAKLKREVSKY